MWPVPLKYSSSAELREPWSCLGVSLRYDGRSSELFRHDRVLHHKTRLSEKFRRKNFGSLMIHVAVLKHLDVYVVYVGLVQMPQRALVTRSGKL